MDKITRYRKIIRSLLDEYSKMGYANLVSVNEVIADKENDRYQLVTMGWEGKKRIHACTFHFDIIGGKIWIQNDQSDHGIVHDLEEKGVPKKDIVLGYYSKSMREVTGYAMA